MVDPGFDLDNLVSNNNFDFISSLTSPVDQSNHPFDLDFSDTPYTQSDFLTEYIDPTAFCNKMSNLNNLSILSLNIQSLSSKYTEFFDLIVLLTKHNCSPEIICLQEIWQIPDPSIFSLPGYQPLIFKCRATLQGGGVAIYVKNGISFKLNPNLSTFIDKLYESIFIEISLINGKKFLIGSLYRSNTQYANLSPNEQFNQFNEILLTTLSSIDPSHPTYILGDFNLDVAKINLNSHVTTYVDSLFTSGFIQSVTKPTRCTSHSATILDHCLTNITQAHYHNFIITSKISDHFPVIIMADSPSSKSRKLTHTFRDFSQQNINNFTNNLNLISWNDVTSTDCPDQAFKNFNETFTTLHNLHFSPKTVKFNINYHKLEPWMSRGLLISRKTKLKLATQLSKFPTPANLSKYKTFRNIYNSTLRAAKKLHFHKAIQNNTNNLKKTWAILKHALNFPKPVNSINALLINNQLITDPQAIANQFNHYFTTIASEIAATIHPTEPPPPPPGHPK